MVKVPVPTHAMRVGRGKTARLIGVPVEAEQPHRRRHREQEGAGEVMLAKMPEEFAQLVVSMALRVQLIVELVVRQGMFAVNQDREEHWHRRRHREQEGAGEG